MLVLGDWIPCVIVFVLILQFRIKKTLSSLYHIIVFCIPVEPHEAVPEVSKGKVHITQNKHVPIEWFVTTASQSRI